MDKLNMIERLLWSLCALGNMREAPETLKIMEDTDHGICSEIDSMIGRGEEYDYWRHTRDRAMQSWEHYSGNTQYPVPYDMEGSRDPAEAYQARTGMWTGVYGAMRWMLLDYLIVWYKAEMASLASSIEAGEDAQSWTPLS